MIIHMIIKLKGVLVLCVHAEATLHGSGDTTSGCPAPWHTRLASSQSRGQAVAIPVSAEKASFRMVLI